MLEPGVDEVDRFARRDRLAKRAFLVAALAFGAAVIGSSIAGGSKPSGTLSLLSVLNILTLFVAPISFGVAVANLSTSDSLALRIVYGLAAGGFAFVVVLSLAFKVFIGSGGTLHM